MILFVLEKMDMVMHPIGIRDNKGGHDYWRDKVACG